MSIFSSIKSVASKAVNAVKSVFSGSSQTASAINASIAPKSNQTLNYTPVPNQTLVPNMSMAGSPSGLGSYGVPVTKTGLAIPQPASLPSPIYSAPITLNSRTASNTSTTSPSTSEISSFSVGSSTPLTLDAGAISSTPGSISLPSAPSYTNPGTINNAGLVSSLAASHAYVPETNSFVEKPADPVTVEEQKRQGLQEKLLALIPKKENVQDSPEIQAQNAEVLRRKQDVANYTGQLNNIVAQQNADLLKLRGIGSQEGVTETVYGGQQAQINREAAIKALPVQAQLAAAQGNLSLAQDYLTQLTSWKTEQVTNEYNYNLARYSAVADYVKGEDKIRLDALIKKEDRAYDMVKANINTQDDLMKEAIKAGQPGLISAINNINPSSPTFRVEIAKAASRLASTNSPASDISMTTVDPKSQSILAQTGLSIPAFSYLTQGTTALTRLSAAQRQQYMKEAADWSKKNNIDISTIQSQFKAQNEVLEKNIARSNNTQIFAGEVSGTVDQFVADIGTDFGKLKVSNVAKLFAGKQVNDKTTQKYAFDLQTMQNDLAGYYAASRGATSPDDADLKSAANVIQQGLNAGSAKAFQESIVTNERKVNKVVDDAVTRAQESVWKLFGVKKPSTTTTLPAASSANFRSKYGY